MASEAANMWYQEKFNVARVGKYDEWLKEAFDEGIALGFAQGAASVQPPANGEKWVRASELEKFMEDNITELNQRAVNRIDKLLASAVPLPSPAVDRAEIVAILATEYHNYFQSDAVSIEQAERTYGLLAEMCGWVK